MNEAKQERYDRAYLKMALEWAKLSHCERKKVGALLVKDGMLISDGYNGTPSGFPMFVKRMREKPIGMCSMQKPMPLPKLPNPPITPKILRYTSPCLLVKIAVS